MGIGGFVVFLVDLILHRWLSRRTLGRACAQAERVLDEARREAESHIRESEIETRDQLEVAEREFEERSRDRSRSLEDRKRTLDQRERNLDRKASLLGEKHKEVEEVRAGLGQDREGVRSQRKDLDSRISALAARLEQVAGMTAIEARQELKRHMEEEARQEVAQTIKRIQEETREKAEELSRWVLVNAIQKIPTQEINDNLTCRVSIPHDEMKGRIIGREGRNIRSIEMNTGVDIIVDDTPGYIVISTFDPLRREMARIAIEKLIEDGRIHPARIEEITNKVREEFEQRIQEEGEAAAYELALSNLHPKLIRLIGTLKYHGRIGQNLLSHSLEVAHIGEKLALELNVDAETVKRAGLLHEIGHVGEPIGGTPPALLSAELASRYNEAEEIIHCLRALGGDVEPRRIEAVLIGIADQASLQRPGARKVSIETHVSRLRRLEEIACSFQGVRSAYAIRTGKEIRVIVDSGTMSDSELIWLSKNIASRITADQVCTGHVKVSVIRETRATDFAL
jgi:ribonuclease Y